MDCDHATCPFRYKDQKGCAFPDAQSRQTKAAGGGQRANSLVVESLEIGRALADHGKAKFRAQGTCMYPCVRPGDTLHIESRLIEDIKVGDITVVRHGGLLFGHRTIAKGEDKDGPYIVTRPDRSHQVSDGPAYGKDILGIVTRIERKGKQASTTPKLLKGCAKIRISFWGWWNWNVRLHLINVIVLVQRLRIYQNIAQLCLKALHPLIRYEVRVPLKPGQSHDLYRVLPADQFNVSQFLQQVKPVMEWTLALYLNKALTPAACATIIHSPDECPRGAGWHIAEIQMRIRYRGAGLDKALVSKGGDILARSAMTIDSEA